MLFEKIVNSDILMLNLGVRDHAQILGHDSEALSKVFSQHQHTCHICGLRTQNALEIDHTAGHSGRGAKGLKPICQFCHDLKHPLWSASRGRLIPIWAPDLVQTDIIRLSWALVAWRDVYPVEYRSVISDFISRKEMLEEFIGWNEIKVSLADNEIPHEAETLFEAAFSAVDTVGRDTALTALRKLDQVVRFIPHEILRSSEDKSFQLSSRLSTWTVGGFRKISKAVSHELLKENDPLNYENLLSETGEDED